MVAITIVMHSDHHITLAGFEEQGSVPTSSSNYSTVSSRFAKHFVVLPTSLASVVL